MYTELSVSVTSRERETLVTRVKIYVKLDVLEWSLELNRLYLVVLCRNRPHHDNDIVRDHLAIMTHLTNIVLILGHRLANLADRLVLVRTKEVI